MPITIGDNTFANFADAVRHIIQTKGFNKERASALVASIARKQGDIEALEYIRDIKRAIEQDFTSIPTITGRKIDGKLAHAGWSRNGRVYPPGVLAAVPPTLPVLLNHATIEGTDGIPEWLLPSSYKERLRRGEDIQLGASTMRYDDFNLELFYSGEITDRHFSNPEVLKHMNVSLGLLFEKENLCDQLACYDFVTRPLWREMSLVFTPGFASATLSTERGRNGSLRTLLSNGNQMNNDDIQHNSSAATEKSGDCGGCNEKKNSKATEQIPPAGQPDMTVTDASNCPEGSAMNTETGNCEPINEETDARNPGPPDVVDEVTEQILNDDDKDKEEDKKKKGEETIFTPRYKIDQLYPSTEGMPRGSGTQDIAQEMKRTVEYYAALKKAKAYNELGQYEKSNEMLEAKLRRMDLTHKLQEAKEKARPRALVPKTQAAIANESTLSAKEFVVPNHAFEWFQKTFRGEDISPAKRYGFNKQYIYENKANRYFKTQKINPYTGGYEMSLIQMDDKQKKATEALSGPPAADFLQTMSEQVIVDPAGGFTTPIRQFCDTKVLAPGQKEGLFYDIDKPTFAAITEGNGPTASVPDSTVNIRSAGGDTSPRGAKVDIKYSEVEEIPFDVVAKLNEGYALESILDETRDLVNTAYNDDTAAVANTRLPKGGGVKTGKWVNGNDGALDPTDTAAGLGSLTFKGLLKTKTIINTAGFRNPNKVTYVSEKGIEDIVQDPAIDSFIQFSRPAIIEEGTAERIAGTNLVSTSELPLDGTGNANVRAVMFVPNVTFGLVTGRDLTMEAQRRNDEQVIKLTGTQKIAGFVKKPEASCRISYTA